MITSYTQTSVLAEGDHILYVQAKDMAGNWSASGTFTITIDLSYIPPPVLTGPFAMTIGDTGDDSINFIDQTSDGGIIMVGYTYSFGTNGDLWIVKMDSVGAIEWEKAIGGTFGVDYGFTVLETADNGFIVAGNAKFNALINSWVHPWIIKFSSTGVVEWEKMISGIYDEEIYSIQQTSDAGYILSGFTSDFSADYDDAWIIKLNSSGVVEWENTYGGTSTFAYDYGRSIRQNSDGSYIVAGSSSTSGNSDDAWIMKLNSNGTVNWSKSFDRATWADVFYDVKQTSDNGFIAVGNSKLSGSDIDILVLKVDSDGNVEWIENIGGTWEESAFSVEETTSGDFVIAGFTDTYTVEDDGTDDGWIIKLSSTGSLLWLKAFGGSSDELFNSTTLTTTGEIIAGGFAKSYGEGLNDAWILRITSDGDCLTLDRNTTATITSSGNNLDLGDFTDTSTTVTVTSTSASIDDTSAHSTETITTAIFNIQVP